MINYLRSTHNLSTNFCASRFAENANYCDGMVMKLGEVARIRRNQIGKTLQQVADGIPGYDAGNLSRFERGEQDMAREKLPFLAKELEVKISQLYDALESGNPLEKMQFDLNVDASFEPEVTKNKSRLIEWADIIDLYKNNELPDQFTIRSNFETEDFKKNSTINIDISRTDTVYFLGIYNDSLDLFYHSTSGSRFFVEFADPRLREKPLSPDGIEIVAGAVSVTLP